MCVCVCKYIYFDSLFVVACDVQCTADGNNASTTARPDSQTEGYCFTPSSSYYTERRDQWRGGGGGSEGSRRGDEGEELANSSGTHYKGRFNSQFYILVLFPSNPQIVQLHQSLAQYRSTILLGPRKSGISTCYQTLSAAYKRMGKPPTDIIVMNPGAYSWEQVNCIHLLSTLVKRPRSVSHPV